MYSGANPELIKLLKGMLEFNPHLRLTAKDALKFKLFDDIRSPHYEQACDVKIHQKINEPDVFDYDTLVNNKYQIEDYKKMLVREIKMVRKFNLLQ